MKTRDRVMMTVGMWVSMLPFILTAIALQFLPAQVPLKDFLSNIVHETSKYNNLFIGLFCLVPFCVVLIAGYLKRRRLIDKNFNIVIVTAMVLSVVFLSIVISWIIHQAKNVDVLRRFDFMGTIAVCVCLVFSFLGCFLPNLVQNDILGIKNSKTLENPEVWAIVHRNASAVMMIGFMLLGTGISFLRGWVALAIALAGIVAFVVWSLIYSAVVSKRIKREQKSGQAELPR